MRRTYVIRNGKAVPKDEAEPVNGHYIIPDTPDYESPIDGRLVSGRKQRREDLARNGCRPYERGEREMARQRARDNERALDAKIIERLRWVNA